MRIRTSGFSPLKRMMVFSCPAPMRRRPRFRSDRLRNRVGSRRQLYRVARLRLVKVELDCSSVETRHGGGAARMRVVGDFWAAGKRQYPLAVRQRPAVAGRRSPEAVRLRPGRTLLLIDAVSIRARCPPRISTTRFRFVGELANVLPSAPHRADGILPAQGLATSNCPASRNRGRFVRISSKELNTYWQTFRCPMKRNAHCSTPVKFAMNVNGNKRHDFTNIHFRLLSCEHAVLNRWLAKRRHEQNVIVHHEVASRTDALADARSALAKSAAVRVFVRMNSSVPGSTSASVRLESSRPCTASRRVTFSTSPPANRVT